MATKLFQKKYDINYDFLYTDSKELWYFIGFVSADGYISDKRIEIALNEKDTTILETFTKHIQPNKPLYYKKKLNTIKMVIDDSKYAKDLKFILSMTSNKKHKELVFPNVPTDYMKDYIRGYCDGDGCITVASARRKFEKLGYTKIYRGVEFKVLGNYNFLKRLNEELNKIYPNKTKSIRKKGKEDVYIVQYNFKTAEGILDELYKESTIHLDRKYKKYIELKSNKCEDIVYSL